MLTSLQGKRWELVRGGNKKLGKALSLISECNSTITFYEEKTGLGGSTFGEAESQEHLFETAKTFAQEGLCSLQDCGEVRKALTSFSQYF